jgi:hypothetical protein
MNQFERSLYGMFYFGKQWIPPFVAAEPLALLHLMHLRGVK